MHMWYCASGCSEKLLDSLGTKPQQPHGSQFFDDGGM